MGARQGGNGLGGAAALTGELAVQARWYAGRFGREFRGTCGEAVRIVQFGEWNRQSGPDFVEAAVSVDGREPRLGAIEIDLDVRDWERHGHAQNPEYEGVVLHVFLQEAAKPFFARTRHNRLIPQVHLRAESTDFLDGMEAHRPGRCARFLAELPVSQLREVLLEAANCRFARKAGAFQRAADAHGWSEALFQAVAGGMGYPDNQLPFTLLAQRLPAARLARETAGVEGLLFGLSGFLPGPEFETLAPMTRRYVRELWEGWWGHRGQLQSLSVPAATWRLGRQRPANHPQRRLGALAALAGHWRAVCRFGRERDWRRLGMLLEGLTHTFWNRHYSFQGRPATRPLALLGRERVEELLVNVFFPATGDRAAWESLRAPCHNKRSRQAAARLLPGRADAASLLKNASLQQGILQLYEDFCRRDASDCVKCPFPETFGQWIRPGA